MESASRALYSDKTLQPGHRILSAQFGPAAQTLEIETVMRNLSTPARRARSPTMPPTLGEMMKASQEDYMSIRQLAFFEALLNEAKRKLLESAHVMQAGLQDDEAHADPADCASVEEEHAMVALLCSREFNQLRKIDDAIDRIHNRSYGWCRDSGEPIGLGRLIACPTAVFCIEAQVLHEHTANAYRFERN